MSELIKTVKQIARLDSPVLISGESGTGKELIARTIHGLSPRKDGPLVIVSCDAIPKDLQEAELCGQTSEGLPNGQQGKRGLFDEAHGGSLFLEEVSELTPRAQVVMHHFLQNGEVTKVGTAVGRCLDVRVIAATTQDLETYVAQDAFREDLYYRLNIIPIYIPPLRERPEDIPLLAQRFVKLTAERMGRPSPPAISPRVMSSFMAQSWRGNVRELECAVERAVAFDRDGIIGMDDLPLDESRRIEDRVLDRARQESLNLNELEREYILEVLAECGGNRKRTAKRLGITTATLWRKLKQYENQSGSTGRRFSSESTSRQ